MIAQIISTLLYTWLAFSIVRAIYNRVQYPGYNSTAEMRERVMNIEDKISKQQDQIFDAHDNYRSEKALEKKLNRYLMKNGVWIKKENKEQPPV